MIAKVIYRLIVVLLSCLPVSQVFSQNAMDFSQVEIKSQKIADNVYMLTGSGGNMGVLTGADGVILIDDQYAPLTDKITAAIAAISDTAIRFLINTHYHGDHTGGNQNLAKAGVIIVAHDNVYRRMSTENFMASFNQTIPASPTEALPVISFSDNVMFHVNNEEVVVTHLQNGHTDGDSIIYFRNANVIHTGDLVFNGAYPLIDISGGGSIDGMIAAQDYILSLADDETRIIPGHGTLGDRAAVQALNDVLITARERVRKLIDAGSTLEQIQAARPNADYDAVYGNGFINPDRFIEFIYTSLTQ
jgi:glyoxylase-like metal-dependent hydrolase (beta-lactamase superfamily II)